jgi:hypothetical protein
VDFATSQGRSRMMGELNKDAEMFQQLGREIEAVSKPLRASLGIDDAVVEDYYCKTMARVKEGLPLDDGEK